MKTTGVVEWRDGRDRALLDDIAAEEPLEIRVGGNALTITMRTPGDDFELAAGFLRAEGVVNRRDDIATALFVHPQTVRYRMGQLRELYGDRLEDPEMIRDLTLALA